MYILFHIQIVDYEETQNLNTHIKQIKLKLKKFTIKENQKLEDSTTMIPIRAENDLTKYGEKLNLKTFVSMHELNKYNTNSKTITKNDMILKRQVRYLW